MEKYICVACPLSCDLVLTVNASGDMEVSGAGCQRGEAYAKNERTAPKRMITTTVRIEGAAVGLLPVIGASPVPKELFRDCLAFLYGVKVVSPVRMGDVIVRDIMNTGVDVLAARSL
jgi:CxxC motif-containing protein